MMPVNFLHFRFVVARLHKQSNILATSTTINSLLFVLLVEVPLKIIGPHTWNKFPTDQMPETIWLLQCCLA